MLRLDPAVHARLAVQAQASGKSLHQYAAEVLAGVLRADREKPLAKLKKDLGNGAKYCEQLLDYDKRGNDIKKYRIKKYSIAKAKII